MMHMAERRGSPQVALLLAAALGAGIAASWSEPRSAAPPAHADCAAPAQAAETRRCGLSEAAPADRA